jgi:hypothetical protein
MGNSVSLTHSESNTECEGDTDEEKKLLRGMVEEMSKDKW